MKKAQQRQEKIVDTILGNKGPPQADGERRSIKVTIQNEIQNYQIPQKRGQSQPGSLVTTKTEFKSHQEAKLKAPLKSHPFDLNPHELAAIKKLFPEFAQSRKTSEHKLQGMPIAQLRQALIESLQIPVELIDKIIHKIDRRSDDTVFWNEFLNSLTDEGNVREIVADAQIYGFGVKRLQFKESHSLKAAADDKMAEHYIHKLVVVQFEQSPLILAFSEDQKVKVYDSTNFKKIQDIKFVSDYGVAKVSKEVHNRDRALAIHRVPASTHNYSRQFSNIDSQELSTTNIKVQPTGGHSAKLESIAERNPKKGPTGRHGEKTKSPQREREQNKGTTFSSNVAEILQKSLAGYPQIGLKQRLMNKRPSSALRINASIPTNNPQRRDSAFNHSMMSHSAVSETSRGHKDTQITFSQSDSQSVGRFQGKKAIKSHFSKTGAENPYVDAGQKIAKNVSTGIRRSLKREESPKLYASQPRITVKASLMELQPVKTTDEGPCEVMTAEKIKKRQTHPDDENYSSDEEATKKLNISPDIIAWKQEKNSFHYKMIERAKQERVKQAKREEAVRYRSKVLGLTDLAHRDEFSMIIEDQEKRPVTDFGETGTSFRSASSGHLPNPNHCRRELARQKVLFNAKLTELDKSSRDVEHRYERRWQKMFKEQCNEYNKSHVVQIPEVRENKGGFDYFSNPALARSVTQKLGYQSKDVLVAKTRRQDAILTGLDIEKRKCDIKLGKLKEKTHAGEKEVNEYVHVNKYNQSSINAEELARLGIRLEKKDKQEAIETTEEYSEFIEKIRKEIKQETSSFEVNQTSSQQQEQKKRAKIKTNKEVYAVSVDYHQELGYVAVALIDREVYVYKAKQQGNKIGFVSIFSFRAVLPNNGTISSISIEKYVTNGQPILILATFAGDILIYWLKIDPDYESLPERQKLEKRTEPKLLKRFNFFDKNIKRTVPQEDSVGQGGRSRGVSFQSHGLQKGGGSFHMNQRPRGLHFGNSFHTNPRGYAQEPLIGNSSHSEINHEDSIVRQAQPAAAPSGLLVDTTKMVTDDYWDLLMNTRPKIEGPDGIYLWNEVQKRIRNPEHTQIVCKILLDQKIDWNRNLDHIMQNWHMCLRVNGDKLSEAIEAFQLTLGKILKNEGSCENSEPRRIKSQPGRKNFKNSKTRKGSRSRNDSKSKDETTEISAKYKDVDLRAKENEITRIKYCKDIGLIGACFKGTVKIFDPFHFHPVWKNSNKSREDNAHTNIVTFDVSQKLGMMATGGAEGRLVVIDPYALGVVNGIVAHKHREILNVFCYEEQQQIITIGEDRQICLWDAFNLEKLQQIKDTNTQHIAKFTSASFDRAKGHLYVGCQQISLYKALVDSKVEIKALQVETLSKAMATEKLQAQSGVDTEADTKATMDACTDNVLISNKSSLVELLVNDCTYGFQLNYLITVDSENLLRGWSLKDTSTSFSYRIKTEDRVTAAATDRSCKFLAVGSATGEAKCLNLTSGGVLYDLPRQDKEITSILFLQEKSEYWIVAGCWAGKIILYTKPTADNYFRITAKSRIGHRGDILTLDCSKLFFVSGGTDGHLSVWNMFTGIMKHAIQLPNPKPLSQGEQQPRRRRTKGASGEANDAGKQIRKTVVGILFHPYFKNVVFVLQEGGDIHGCDIQTGEVVAEHCATVQTNSNWACDEENMRVFVCGDLGKAILFDIDMGASEFKRKGQNLLMLQSDQRSWRIEKMWFTAHYITKYDSFFVNCVKFSRAAGFWVTGTNNGQVKLWSADYCDLLGQLNGKDWVGQTITEHIEEWKEQREISE